AARSSTVRRGFDDATFGVSSPDHGGHAVNAFDRLPPGRRRRCPQSISTATGVNVAARPGLPVGLHDSSRESPARPCRSGTMGTMGPIVSALPKSIDRLLNLGVTPNMPLDLLLAVRGTNFIALAMSLVSVGGIIMALGGHDSAGFALAVGVCLVAYLGTLFLDGCGLYDAARFGFLTIACVHWAMVSVALGPRSGIRFGVVALIIYPLTGFARSEGRKTAIAYLIIAVSVVAAEVLTRRFGPLVAFSEKMLERGDYFILASLAALCGFGIRYHQRAAARSGPPRVRASGSTRPISGSRTCWRTSCRRRSRLAWSSTAGPLPRATPKPRYSSPI